MSLLISTFGIFLVLWTLQQRNYPLASLQKYLDVPLLVMFPRRNERASLSFHGSSLAQKRLNKVCIFVTNKLSCQHRALIDILANVIPAFIVKVGRGCRKHPNAGYFILIYCLHCETSSWRSSKDKGSISTVVFKSLAVLKLHVGAIALMCGIIGHSS